jgi:hypothetical protein
LPATRRNQDNIRPRVGSALSGGAYVGAGRSATDLNDGAVRILRNVVHVHRNAVHGDILPKVLSVEPEQFPEPQPRGSRPLLTNEISGATKHARQDRPPRPLRVQAEPLCRIVETDHADGAFDDPLARRLDVLRLAPRRIRRPLAQTRHAANGDVRLARSTALALPFRSASGALATVVHMVDAASYRPAACQPIKSLHHVIDDTQRTERT